MKQRKEPKAHILPTVTVDAAAIGEPTDLQLKMKVELATRAVDSLMFSGQVGTMVTAMAQMAGIPEVSISLILPSKKPANMRPFLDCLRWIISTALDEAVTVDDFYPKLADAIQEIKRIVDEEK